MFFFFFLKKKFYILYAYPYWDYDRLRNVSNYRIVHALALVPKPPLFLFHFFVFLLAAIQVHTCSLPCDFWVGLSWSLSKKVFFTSWVVPPSSHRRIKLLTVSFINMVNKCMTVDDFVGSRRIETRQCLVSFAQQLFFSRDGFDIFQRSCQFQAWQQMKLSTYRFV